MTFSGWWARIVLRLRIVAEAWEGAGRGFATVGWLLLPALLLINLWPIFNVERMLGAGALMLIGIGAALGVLLVRIIKARSLRF